MRILPIRTRIETTPKAADQIRGYWESVLRLAKTRGEPTREIRRLALQCSPKAIAPAPRRLAESTLLHAFVDEWKKTAGPFVKVISYGAKGSYAEFRVALSWHANGRLSVSIYLASEIPAEAVQ